MWSCRSMRSVSQVQTTFIELVYHCCKRDRTSPATTLRARRALHMPACGGTKLPPANGTWQASGGRPAPSFTQNFHARASNFSQRQQSYSEGSWPPAAPPGFCNPVLPLTWLGSRGGSFGPVQLLTRSPPQWEHSPAFSTTLQLLTGLKSNATGHGESLLQGKGWLRVRMRRCEHP